MNFALPRGAFLLQLLLAVASATGAPEPAIESRFMESVARHHPSSERPAWDAYVAREGIETMTRSYFAVGTGMCGFLKQGVPATDLIENFRAFYGLARAQALADAAREVICPELAAK